MNPDDITPEGVRASVFAGIKPDPLTVHIDELHDGRYVAWAVWPGGQVDHIVQPADDIRTHGGVYEQVGYFMLDCGEGDVLVRKHRRSS